jgi:predicted DNA-binding transcriptional regulator AlpA
MTILETHLDPRESAYQNLRGEAASTLLTSTERSQQIRPAAHRQAIPNYELALWPLRTVLAHVPISRSAWLSGVKEGRYPPPVRLSPRRVAWRVSDIRAFVASL